MVKVMLDTYIENSTEREMHIRYDRAIPNDQIIMTILNDLLCNEQPLCSNCVNYRKEGYFCGYCASSCKIHGNIEAWDHPHHDGDGGKCPDYVRETRTASEIVKDRECLMHLAHEKEQRKRLRKYYEKLQSLKEDKNNDA
jgi:hypothetical protein